MSARQPLPIAGVSAAPCVAAGAGTAPAEPGPPGRASAWSTSGVVSVPPWHATPDSIDRHQALARMWAQLPVPGSMVVTVRMLAACSPSGGCNAPLVPVARYAAGSGQV
eukprot:3320926-Pleurochrysis_carterae.AAC.1